MACDHDSDFQSLLPAIKEAVDRTMALPPADDQSGACILASNRRATILLIGSSPDSCHQALRTHSQNFPFSPDIDTVLFLKNDITNDICSLSNDKRERLITGGIALAVLHDFETFPRPPFVYSAALLVREGGILVWTQGWEAAIKLCSDVYVHVQKQLTSARRQGLAPCTTFTRPPDDMDLDMLWNGEPVFAPLSPLFSGSHLSESLESFPSGVSSFESPEYTYTDMLVSTSPSDSSKSDLPMTPEYFDAMLRHYSTLDRLSSANESYPTSWAEYQPYADADVERVDLPAIEVSYHEDIDIVSPSSALGLFGDQLHPIYTPDIAPSPLLSEPKPQGGLHLTSPPAHTQSFDREEAQPDPTVTSSSVNSPSLTPDLIPGSILPTPDSPDIPLSRTLLSPLPGNSPFRSRSRSASSASTPEHDNLPTPRLTPALSSKATSSSRPGRAKVDEDDFEYESSDDEDDEDDDTYYPGVGSPRKRSDSLSQRKRVAISSPHGEPQAIRVSRPRPRPDSHTSPLTPATPKAASSTSSTPLFFPPPDTSRRQNDYPSRTTACADPTPNECKYCTHPPFTRSSDAARHTESSCWLRPNRSLQECEKCGVPISRGDAYRRHQKNGKCKGRKGVQVTKGCVKKNIVSRKVARG